MQKKRVPEAMALPAVTVTEVPPDTGPLEGVIAHCVWRRNSKSAFVGEVSTPLFET